MEAMTYVIRFEENLDLGDIDHYLKEIESPIRLEIGDKIVLRIASFNMDLEDNLANITIMKDLLLAKAMRSTLHTAIFEISDIMYNHEFYDDDDDEINFHGVITLKGK